MGKYDRIDGKGTVDDTVKDIVILLNYVILPTLEKHEKTLEDNRGGLDFASKLDSRATTVIVTGIIAAAVFAAAKTGGLL